MLQEAEDLLAESEDLAALLAQLDDSDWQTPTQFMKWTPWDVVAHLHYFDWVSMLSLEGEEAFVPLRDQLVEALVAGRSNRELAREKYGELGADELVAQWRATNRELAAALGACDPKRRLPWFGPDMGVRMFTTARFMETWAHAQEIYDLKGVERRFNDRIKNIVVIGVKTFGWTFINRGREVPGPPPYLRLTAPSGAVWEFNEPSEEERVSGSAVDFCQTVTQVRNVADTSLEVVGPIATEWMSIAQCFAGGAVDPPPPGTRKPAN